MRRNRKSQVALFILLGMVIFIIFGFMFFAVKLVTVAKIEKQVDKVYSDFLRTTALSYYVDKCLKQVSQEGLYITANQGGNFYPAQVDDPLVRPLMNKGVDLGSDPNFNFTYLLQPLSASPAVRYPSPPEYPCLSTDQPKTWPFCKYEHDVAMFTGYPYGIDILPPLCEFGSDSCAGEDYLSAGGQDELSIEYQLKRYVEQHLERCVDIESILPSGSNFAGFNLTEGNVTASLSFGESDVTINVSFPIEFFQENREPVIRESFYYDREDVRLKPMYRCIKKLVEKENRVIDFNPGIDYVNIGYCKNLFKVEVNPDVLPSIDAIRVIDYQSTLYSAPYRFTLGVVNRNPVLDYIGYDPQPGVDFFVVEGDNITILPWAGDPDATAPGTGIKPDDNNLMYNYTGDGKITTAELQGSEMFKETQKDTSYQTTHNDVGYHNITLRVTDGYLVDYQLIRILVDDILHVVAIGQNIYEDILDNNLASIEDPYMISVNEETPDIFNAGSGREYIWMDYDEYPDGDEIFYQETSEFYPILVIPFGNPNDEKYILNVTDGIFSACSYLQYLENGVVTNHPSFGCNTGTDPLLEQVFNKVSGLTPGESQFVTHHMTLEVNTSPKATSDLIVNVTQCLPHRTGMPPYPESVPSYPFSHFDGDSYPDVDTNRKFHMFLGNHTCCSSGGTYPWGTVMPSSVNCYNYDEYFCGAPLERDALGTGVINNAVPKAPNLNQVDGGPLLGNQDDDIDVMKLNAQGDPEVIGSLSMEMENNVFHRSFTVQCDGKRGNICNGTADDSYILYQDCGGFDGGGSTPLATQRCRGCGSFGEMIDRDALNTMPSDCFEYQDTTFERKSGLPDRDGVTDFSKYLLSSGGTTRSSDEVICNPYWKCSSKAEYGGPGPFRAQSTCYNGNCNDKPINLYCEADGKIGKSANDDYELADPKYGNYINGGCGQAKLACDDLRANTLPHETGYCDEVGKPYLRDYCNEDCQSGDIYKYSPVSNSLKRFYCSDFEGCDCGDSEVDKYCDRVNVFHPYIPRCNKGESFYQDKCEVHSVNDYTLDSSVTLVDDDRHFEFVAQCGSECYNQNNPTDTSTCFGCAWTQCNKDTQGNDICSPFLDDTGVDDPGLCQAAINYPDCLQCLKDKCWDKCEVCGECCETNYETDSRVCWTKSISASNYPNDPSLYDPNLGGVDCHAGNANRKDASNQFAGNDVANDDGCHLREPGSVVLNTGSGQGCDDECNQIDCQGFRFFTQPEVKSYLSGVGDQFARCVTHNDVDEKYGPLDDNDYGDDKFCADGYDLDIGGVRGNSGKTACVKCNANSIQLSNAFYTQNADDGTGKCESGAPGSTVCNAAQVCDETAPNTYSGTSFCKGNCQVCTKEVAWSSTNAGSSTKRCGCGSISQNSAYPAKPCDGAGTGVNSEPIDMVLDGVCITQNDNIYNCEDFVDQGVTGDYGKVCNLFDEGLKFCDKDLSDLSIDKEGICTDTDSNTEGYDGCLSLTDSFCVHDGAPPNHGILKTLQNCDTGDLCEEASPTNLAASPYLAFNGLVYGSLGNRKCCIDIVTYENDGSIHGCYNIDQGDDDPGYYCEDRNSGNDWGVSYLDDNQNLQCCTKQLIQTSDGWECANIDLDDSHTQCLSDLSDAAGSGGSSITTLYVPATKLKSFSGWTTPCLSTSYASLIINVKGFFYSLTADFMYIADDGSVIDVEEGDPLFSNVQILICGEKLTPASPFISFTSECKNKPLVIISNDPNFQYMIKLKAS